MTFEVQTLTVCDGWINLWHDTGNDNIRRRVTFETREVAEQALADFLAGLDHAVARGDMSDSKPRNHSVTETMKNHGA